MWPFRTRSSVPPIEERSGMFAGFPVATFGLDTGVRPVSPMMAENLPTMLACVDVVSSTIASLPAMVYRREGTGRVEAPEHPVARLLRTPNAWQTWPDLCEWLVASTLIHGNGLCSIEMDAAGNPTELRPIPWSCVIPVMLPNGRLAYDVAATVAPWSPLTLPRRFLDTEVLHLKDRSDNGIIGRSRLSRAPQPHSNAVALQDYSQGIWSNAATPKGVLTVPGKLSEASAKRLKLDWTNKFAGPNNAGATAVLEEGTAFQAMSITPEDAELLASRKFSVEEVCRIYRVPPPLVQDYSRNTFTNAATAGLWFAQFSLAPWIVKIEAECKRSLLGASSDYDLCIDMGGLTRGDYAARWTAYGVAAANHILSVDEMREAEGYGPMPAAPVPPPMADPVIA